jgi:hypothetical protein
MSKPKPEISRVVAPERGEDDALEASLRPKRLAEFVGQKQARENLAVFIAAARGRRANSASISARRQVRSLPGPATLLPS